mmetsp:Transcript_38125/g.120092  ORF Transcript_38125/g.120092 Transcript_38125/m.120092 type:complete len:208 (-) Transcript_38125:314-937(-)
MSVYNARPFFFPVLISTRRLSLNQSFLDTSRFLMLLSSVVTMALDFLCLSTSAVTFPSNSPSTSISSLSSMIPYAFRSSCAVSLNPRHSAHSRALKSFSARASSDAPSSRKRSHASVSPCSAATCKGVLEPQSLASRSAPASTRHWIMSHRPKRAASCRLVELHISDAFTSAPCSTSRANTSACPLTEASKTAVRFPNPWASTGKPS